MKIASRTINQAGLGGKAARSIRGLIMGSPGSGKGTQTTRILKAFPAIQPIGSGDTLREHILNKSSIGIEIAEIVKRGGLVPDSLITPLMLDKVREGLHLPSHEGISTPGKGTGIGGNFLLDGFPRTKDQAQLLDEFLDARESHLVGNSGNINNQSMRINFVINLKVPWQVILQRIRDRFIHAPSGRTYNLSFNPPLVVGKDDLTGEPLTKRADDDVDTFQRRLEAYREQTLPVVDYYREQEERNGGRRVLFEFEGETSDEITPNLLKALEGHFSLSA